MSQPKWTTADIHDQSGRTAIVTGSNTGLGLETARALAEHGASVVIAVRDPSRGAAAADDIRRNDPDADLAVQQLDLASLDSVREAADALRSAHPKVDLLINNAGVMYTPQSTTSDGFDLQFGVNHLGHFALTGLLMDHLRAVDGARVVSVSSVGHRVRSRIDFDDLGFDSGYSRVAAYGRSKLANLLFTYELQRRLTAADAAAAALVAHPGLSDTELVRNSPAFMRLSAPLFRPFTQSAAKGALPQLRAATDPDAVGGQYYGPDGFAEGRGNPVVVSSSDRSHEQDTQRKLWETSEELTGVQYPI